MAAPVVSCEAVTVVAGTTTLLDAVSLGISVGERIGVVGRNGAGKSTLMSVLAGTRHLDAGRVVHPTGTRIGVLAQADELDPDATVLHAVVGDAAEHTWRGDAHIRSVLAGLGIEPLLDRRCGSLSGGERRRVALAALLDADLDLLLLDEPTNHLDVEGVGWLAGHLTGRPRHRALVAVTHDRWFLDEVATSTWEVVGGTVQSYDGGYAAYVLARAERSRQRDASEARRANLVRKELAWLRRGAPARTSKPRYRVEAANALIAAEPPPRDREGLQRFAAARLGKQVYDVEDATVVRGGRTLLDDVTWRLGPGDRVGLVGVNGAGKTTLLRVLVGELPLDAGTVRTGLTVQVAYLSQDVAELDGGLRVLEAVQQVANVLTVGAEELTAGQLLERFGFAADRQWTPVADLSGGERRRLQLLRLLMAGPNVLVLDEPTNDLDTDTLVALEDLLDAFAGTVVVVSHDRWFLERVCDTTAALMGDGSLAALPGGVGEYLARRVAAPVVPAEAAARPAGDSRAARKELASVERSIQKLDRQEAALHEGMAAAATDHVRVQQLDGELRALRAQRAEAEDRWLELADEAG
jgi:ATP-binding cassette subfamily F protein uup